MNLFDGRLTPADPPQAPQAQGLRLDDCVTRNSVEAGAEALRMVDVERQCLREARAAYERAGEVLDAACEAYAVALREAAQRYVRA